jgi:hypothetical protein
VSIDSRIFVPTGARNRKPDDPHYTLTKIKYKAGDSMPESQMTQHQVYLAHMIDEQYFFEDTDDARWFWVEGYKRCLYLGEDGQTVMPYERMALWINGWEIDQRGYEPDPKDKNEKSNS